jgi:hypothetical protein
VKSLKEVVEHFNKPQPLASDVNVEADAMERAEDRAQAKRERFATMYGAPRSLQADNGLGDYYAYYAYSNYTPKWRRMLGSRPVKLAGIALAEFIVAGAGSAVAFYFMR